MKIRAGKAAIVGWLEDHDPAHSTSSVVCPALGTYCIERDVVSDIVLSLPHIQILENKQGCCELGPEVNSSGTRTPFLETLEDSIDWGPQAPKRQHLPYRESKLFSIVSRDPVSRPPLLHANSVMRSANLAESSSARRTTKKERIHRHPVCIVLTQTAPSSGSSVTVLPGFSGVPLWSVLPAYNIHSASC